MLLAALRAERAAEWGSAPFERVAGLLAPMHERLLERLSPRAGERWLDLAAGGISYSQLYLLILGTRR